MSVPQTPTVPGVSWRWYAIYLSFAVVAIIAVAVVIAATTWLPGVWLKVLYSVTQHPGFGSLFGSMIAAATAASITIWVAIWGAPAHARHLKLVDATLEFSNRFQDLLDRRRALNMEYEQISRDVDSQLSKRAAQDFYRRFFDLLQFEFKDALI
jgi:hypothetical protein